MNSDDLIDQVITSLKIVGMVQKNGRLCVRRGQLDIDVDDRWQPIRRWFNRDSRDQIVLHMRNCIASAVKLSKGIISGQIETDMKNWTVSRLITEMTNCQNGLLNLKTTYCDDPAMVATIDVLMERLGANCAELSAFSNKENVNTSTTEHISHNKNKANTNIKTNQ